MRNMSFALTEPQILAQSKTVTRRLGWSTLQPGTMLQPVHKCMGLKPGEKPRKLGGPIRVVSVRRETLDAITDDDVAREGYPGESGKWFVAKFCKAMGCEDWWTVTRIEFEYVRAEERAP